MNFYKKAMMAEGGEMPEYGQGGKMPQYQEGGMMDQGAQQLQMLKAAYDKAVEEGNREVIEKIESAVSEMMMSAKDDRVKEMLMEMFPGMGQSMAVGGKLEMVENKDGDKVPFYAADGIGKMMAGGMLGKKKEEMTYPGGGYVMMK